MKRTVSGVFLWAALLALLLVGCDSGQIEVGSDDVQIQSNDPAPQVISMDKTANASTLSGPIKLYLGMSDELSTAPSIEYQVLFGSGASASVSKASETAECTLLDGGNSVACPLTVAGCNAMVDYSVRVSGGVSAKGVEMEPFDMILNSGDMEAGSIAEIDNCWEYFNSGDERLPTFDAVAELEIESGTLKWQMLENPGDVALANVFKELYSFPSVAVAMRVVGTPSLDFYSGASFVGMQVNPLFEGDSLSAGYRAMIGGAVLTTWSDDFNFALYSLDSLEPADLSIYYTCIVKDVSSFRYFISADGVNFVELVPSNVELMAREDCGLPAPIDAGWECPDDPLTEMCDPEAPWGTAECSATYADCLAHMEMQFSDELCAEGGFADAFGASWASPVLRIMGYGGPGNTTPGVDYVRFRTTNIVGDVSNCPEIY